jgi:hypothetical protein
MNYQSWENVYPTSSTNVQSTVPITSALFVNHPLAYRMGNVLNSIQDVLVQMQMMDHVSSAPSVNF